VPFCNTPAGVCIQRAPNNNIAFQISKLLKSAQVDKSNHCSPRLALYAMSPTLHAWEAMCLPSLDLDGGNPATNPCTGRD
jgi:hypothetical protein